MIGLLLAMLCWDPVEVDCLGAPLTQAPIYRHEEATVRIAGSQMCDVMDASAGMCPVYDRSPFNDVAFGADPCASADPNTGPIHPGEILFLRTTAIVGAQEDCGTFDGAATDLAAKEALARGR